MRRSSQILSIGGFQVMLFGASSKDVYDRNMQITVAFNKFGPGLTQRMPR